MPRKEREIIIQAIGKGDKKMKRAKISKEEYFQKMKETTNEVYGCILSFIEKEYKDPNLREKILILVKRREKKLLARPFIARLGYEVCGGKNWRKIILPGVLLELESISNYQSNAAFDSKYGVADDDLEKVNQIIASFLTRNLIQRIIDIEIAKKYGNRLASEVSKIIYEIDVFNYMGQFNELNNLGIKNFNFNISLKEYLRIYLRVKYLYGGKWIRNSLLMGALFVEKRPTTETIKILKKFGIYCGTPYTIVNDLSDFCMSHVERGFKVSIHDQFKDVWNGRVTLPLYYALSDYSRTKRKEREFLLKSLRGETNRNIKSMKRILKILLDSGSLNFSYSIMNFLRRKAKSIIKKLPLSPERDSLLLLNSALRTNKFISELRGYGLKLVELDKETISFLENLEENICN